MKKGSKKDVLVQHLYTQKFERIIKLSFQSLIRCYSLVLLWVIAPNQGQALLTIIYNISNI